MSWGKKKKKNKLGNYPILGNIFNFLNICFQQFFFFELKKKKKNEFNWVIFGTEIVSILIWLLLIE